MIRGSPMLLFCPVHDLNPGFLIKRARNKKRYPYWNRLTAVPARISLAGASGCCRVCGVMRALAWSASPSGLLV